VAVSDLDKAERLAVAAGATKAAEQPTPGSWRVLLDPAGHPFCVTTLMPGQAASGRAGGAAVRSVRGLGDWLPVTHTDRALRIHAASPVTGRFTPRSGRTATEYFDKYRFEADPLLLDEIARRLAEGADVAGRRVLVVEDVVTSGGQIVLSTADLRGLRAHVGEALCVIDRERGGAAALEAEGIGLASLLTAADLRAAAAS
jgi:orotate phosphoribosyltransferase